ncbi:ATP-binding protein [Oceanobacillus kimchii]|uniref:ATP-binding protein n=1 Tax=Oceanobacillus kimchii TaxID=746691 RepID=UPI003B02E056
MNQEFKKVNSTIAQVIQRAENMSKNYKKSNQPDHLQDYKCKDCNDLGFILDKVKENTLSGKNIRRDVYRPCSCAEKKHKNNRFKNSLIPNEFQDARFDNYEQKSNVQRVLFKATQDYLRAIPKIISERPKNNSLGFLAVFGESHFKSLNMEERIQAKSDHNNFGIGKTHLQIAAAKWIMNNIRIPIEKANEDDPIRTRGCNVLCISDVSYMDELISLKMSNDGGSDFLKSLNNAINADVLVWDDFAKSKYSEAKQNLYYRIIDERYRHRRPILFNSNEDISTLNEKIGYAASSRLIGMCRDRIYHVEGEDYRLFNRN